MHVDQDGEGFLSIRVHLSGPDLYVLNKAIASTAQLFDTTMTSEGLAPPLPLMSPGEDAFAVTDALCDCAVEWIRDRWGKFEVDGARIPVTAASMEGYGTLSMVKLVSTNEA